MMRSLSKKISSFAKLNSEDQIQKKEYCHLKVISIGIKYLNQCVEIDQLSLKGLWSRDQWIKELKSNNRKCFGIILDSKIIAIACGWIVIDELQVTSVAVHPTKRRLGLGEKVLSSLLSEARANGVKNAILEVKKTNIAARSLYIKLGFTHKGLRKNFYQDGSDALILSCDLMTEIVSEK